MSELLSRLDAAARRACDRPRPWLVGFTLLLALQINPWWWPGRDAGHYLSMARSVAHGQGFRAFGELDVPRAGYPLLVSPAFLVSERPFLILSVVHWLLAVAILLGVYRWARRLAGPAALLLAGLVVLNAGFGMHSRTTLTEIPFMAATIWAVIAAHEALGARRVVGTVGWGLAGGLLLASAVAIRPLGVVLLPGVALAALLEVRRGRVSWGRAVALCGTACGLGALSLLLLAGSDYTGAGRAAWPGATYLQPLLGSLGGGLASVLEGLRARVDECGRLLIPGMVKTYDKPHVWLGINTLTYIPVTFAVLVGWVRLIRRHSDALALAAPFYVGILLLWPFDQGIRFGLPMLPLMWACVWMLLGGDAGTSSDQGASSGVVPHRTAVLAVLLTAHLAVATGYFIRDAVRVQRLNQTWGELEAVAAPMRAAPGRVVACGVSQEQELMLRFLIDLQVDRSDEIAAIPADARWVVLGQEAAVPGFVVRVRSGGMTLLEGARR